MTEAVKVMVRCRPMSQKQKERGCTNVVHIDSSINQVRILKTDAKEPPKTFSFDFVFGADSLQSLVYQQTAFSLVDNVLQGYNGTIFAYGQTGCGKTHTMMGSNQSQQSKGIIPRTFHQIITLTNSQKQKKHLVHCSFIQIYNQEIHDLLGRDIKARMDLKQSPDKGVFVKDLTMNIVKSEQQMQKFMDIGFKNRAVRETAMNKQSSRSHSIFTIHIESQQIDQLGKQKFKAGKLNLVDLAGSQRQSKTNATGDGMKEAAKINLSLSALGNVISALVDGKTHHIPYRDSKLTRLLQDSLGGNTKTIMIAAVSPADYNYDQTLSTLRYASRAKFIQNKPIINEDPKDTLLRQYAQQIKNLKMMLEGKVPMTQSMIKQMGNVSEGGVIYKQVFIQKGGEGNEDLKNQLKSKQDALRFQQQQKQRLKEQMQNLQKLISHQDTAVDKKQLQKMNKLKEKLKLQKKKQEQYLSQKKKKEVQLLTMEKSYKSLNEEVQAMRIKFAQIKAKYLQNEAELRDIKGQHQRQKQQLLDTIRAQQSQVSKYSSILKMLLTSDQIQQIVSQSEYDDQTKQWTIVPFYYRQKNVNFPKLGGNHTKQFIQNQKDKKQVVFRDSREGYQRKSQKQVPNYFMNDNSMQIKPQFEKKTTKVRESYRISEVVKGARQLRQPVRDKQKTYYNGKYNQGGSINTLSHNQLSPLNPNLKQPKTTSNKNNLNLKSQSQQRIKLDEGSFNNLNKIKLNPIQTKKEIILKQIEEQNYNNQHFPYNGFT